MSEKTATRTSINAMRNMANIHEYSIEQSKDDSFFEGRQANIFVKGKSVGILGLIHPNVLNSFGLKYPCSAIEMNLDLINI